MKTILDIKPIKEFLSPKLKMPKNILDINVKYEIFATNKENIILAFLEKFFLNLIKK